MDDYFSLDLIPQETERIFFKKIDNHEYFNSFHNYSLQKDLYSHLEFDPFKNKKETKVYLEKLTKRIKSRNADYRYLIMKETNQFAGLFGFHNYDAYHQSVEFGYGVSPLMQRKGIFLEVSNHLIKFLFKTSKIHRIYAYTSAENLPSIKGLEALGFQKEGLIKDFYLKKQIYFDAFLYALIRKD